MTLVASEWVPGSEFPNLGNPALMNLGILGAWTYVLFLFFWEHIDDEDTISSVMSLAHCRLH